jgi:hypothetical protein
VVEALVGQLVGARESGTPVASVWQRCPDHPRQDRHGERHPELSTWIEGGHPEEEMIGKLLERKRG